MTLQLEGKSSKHLFLLNLKIANFIAAISPLLTESYSSLPIIPRARVHKDFMTQLFDKRLPVLLVRGNAKVKFLFTGSWLL
jgi:hypothetical protein